MFYLSRLPKLICAVAVLLIFGGGCTSSGPKTTFYSLFPKAEQPGQFALNQSTISVGVGPVSMPEFLDNLGIVSTSGNQVVRVSGYHAWAGDLKSSITRVIALDLSRHFDIDDVWPFPWDTRTRPDVQLRISIDEFYGRRGGDVTLSARWVLLTKRARKELGVDRITLTRTTANDSVETYVAALNDVLGEFTQRMAAQVQPLLNDFESTP